MTKCSVLSPDEITKVYREGNDSPIYVQVLSVILMLPKVSFFSLLHPASLISYNKSHINCSYYKSGNLQTVSKDGWWIFAPRASMHFNLGHKSKFTLEYLYEPLRLSDSKLGSALSIKLNWSSVTPQFLNDRLVKPSLPLSFKSSKYYLSQLTAIKIYSIFLPSVSSYYCRFYIIRFYILQE